MSKSNNSNMKNKFSSKQGKRVTSFRNTEDVESNTSKSRGSGKASASHCDSYNDASWYASSPSLLRDSASFSFNNPLGNSVTLFPSNVTVDTKYAIPGVMSLYLQPGPGVSQNGTSPVNIAARNIYSYVRHANSGHTNYESADLMMYLLAMDSAYSMLAFMYRAYGILRTYSQVNRYLPKALFTSMNLDFDDFETNIANFRYYVNTCTIKLGSLCVPKSMNYFVRHMWCFSNVYADDLSQKSGMYIYNPYGYYVYTPVAETTGGSLTWHAFQQTPAANLIGLSALVNIVDTMINALMTDEDINIMSGDILKAFGSDGVLKLGSLPEDYTVVPVYNPEVLSQIHNATVLSVYNSSMNITQSNGAIRFLPYSAATPVVIQPQIYNLVDLRDMDTTPEKVMVATRLTVPTVTTSKTTNMPLEYCGSEIVAEARIFKFAASGSDWKVPIRNAAPSFRYFSTAESVTSMLSSSSNVVDGLTKFDWHPYAIFAVYAAPGGEGVSQISNLTILGDVSNYTVMHPEDLRKMHETALLSLFNVPQMGSWNDKVSN